MAPPPSAITPARCRGPVRRDTADTSPCGDGPHPVSVTNEPSMASRRSPPSRPLRKNRDFLLLWTGAGLSVLGNRMATVTYPLLTIWYTGSTVNAGFVGFAALLPMLLVQLPAGLLVDRVDRRRTMITCDVVGAAAMISLVVALALGQLWLPHVMLVAFVEGSVATVYRLAERAAVRNVVHPDHLSSALSQNEARGRAAGLVGQPAGSSLFVVLRWVPFLANAVGHVLSATGLLLIRSDLQGEQRRGRPRLRSDLAEGLRWLRGQRLLRTAVCLAAGSNVLFQVVNLAVVVVVRESGASPAVLGVIGTLSGAGGVCGALLAPPLLKRLTPSVILIGAYGVWTVLMLPLALTANPFALGGLLAGTTFVGATMNVSAGVYQVQVTPDAMQGRVAGVALLLASGTNSLGAMCGGFVLDALGTRRTLFGVTAAMLAITVAAAASPAVRNADRTALTQP